MRFRAGVRVRVRVRRLVRVHAGHERRRLIGQPVALPAAALGGEVRGGVRRVVGGGGRGHEYGVLGVRGELPYEASGWQSVSW